MNARRLNAAVIAPQPMIDYVFGNGRLDEIASRTQLISGSVQPQRIEAELDSLREVDVLFSTWGMPALNESQLDRMPRLRGVFYAAGSVKGFARPILERGITLVSAWRANAVSVARFTLAQILLSTKGYFRNLNEYDGSQDKYQTAFRGAGSYGETVALLGVGAIGRMVIELLRPFDLKVIVYDPYLDPSTALALGVERVTMEEAFESGYIVSNHMADIPATHGIINAHLLGSLRQNATFINTGRGRTVDEPALVELLKHRPDVIALLDVSDPEPTTIDSRLLQLPNAKVTSHIAGAINDEVWRMADLCIGEFDRFERGLPLQHAVTLEALTQMA